MRSHPDAAPHSFRIRNESDVLALVPYTLGFHPERSLVVVSLDRVGRPFLARVDLPDRPSDIDVVIDQLVFPVRRADGIQAILVAYSGDVALAEATVAALADALEGAGVDVLLRIRAHASRWYPLGLTEPGLRGVEGVPYDLASHELTSRSVLDGRVTFSNRADLAESLAPIGWEVLEEVAAAYDSLGPSPSSRRDLRMEARWLVRRVQARVTSANPVPDPPEAARLLRGLAVTEVRDVVWCGIERTNADSHVLFWRELVRRSPEELVAPAAGLLAFSAWQAGHGALAWCAVDRCIAADPDYGMARLVAQALDSAAPPSVWQPREPRTLPLYAG